MLSPQEKSAALKTFFALAELKLFWLPIATLTPIILNDLPEGFVPEI
jgi:hypothetical protein